MNRSASSRYASRSLLGGAVAMRSRILASRARDPGADGAQDAAPQHHGAGPGSARGRRRRLRRARVRPAHDRRRYDQREDRSPPARGLRGSLSEDRGREVDVEARRRRRSQRAGARARLAREPAGSDPGGRRGARPRHVPGDLLLRVRRPADAQGPRVDAELEAAAGRSGLSAREVVSRRGDALLLLGHAGFGLAPLELCLPAQGVLLAEVAVSPPPQLRSEPIEHGGETTPLPLSAVWPRPLPATRSSSSRSTRSPSAGTASRAWTAFASSFAAPFRATR